MENTNWVDVKEATPTNFKKVLVAVKLSNYKTYVGSGMWFGDHFCNDYGDRIKSRVTHWMELPVPPKLF